MAASLSAYWVKFFKGAGFPLDVATKHAVVFSNNRIKPDMLPDLDKPSLKDMGITLMGDMIAILRYAKKVVEETTCERFLVDTEDDKPMAARNSVVARTIVKKAVAAKVPSKSAAVVAAKPKITPGTATKTAKTPASIVTKTTAAKKKIVPNARVVSQVVKESLQAPAKRKVAAPKSASESESEDEWLVAPPKRAKLPAEDEKIGYSVVVPKGRTIRTQEITKKITDQKRTVFDRLGDSSVTSTTNLAENLSSPTFNITGLGSDVLKRNSSVFNRLGEKEARNIERIQAGAPKNGAAINALTTPQGILKNKPSIGSTTITLKNSLVSATNKATGTMHADHERSQKSASSSVKQLVRTTKKIRLSDGAPIVAKATRKVATASSKLASERFGSVSAKARLGLTGAGSAKQVTFDRVTKVAHIKKPGVFSRLGI